MKKFYYFVSFAHQEGFANCCISLNNPITTFDKITDIENLLASKDRSIREITVLYYQLLRVENEE